MGTRRAVRLTTDHAMNARTVDHDVDAVYAVALRVAREGDAMLSDRPTGLQLVHCRAC